MKEMYSIAQQLFTSHLPNEDYASILLSHSQDVVDLRDKVVEVDTRANPDKWLDANEKVTMPEAFQSLREEYLTSVGPMYKDNSPTHIVDAVNEAYKSQLKANHQIGKGIAHELTSLETITDKGLQSINTKLALDDAKISS